LDNENAISPQGPKGRIELSPGRQAPESMHEYPEPQRGGRVAMLRFCRPAGALFRESRIPWPAGPG